VVSGSGGLLGLHCLDALTFLKRSTVIFVVGGLPSREMVKEPLTLFASRYVHLQIFVPN
jgi:hypothetical protein